MKRMEICSMVAKIMILMRKSGMMDLLRSFEQHYKTDDLVSVILFSWLGPRDFEKKKRFQIDLDFDRLCHVVK